MIKPQAIDIFDHFDSKAELSNLPAKKKVAFVTEKSTANEKLANDLLSIKRRGWLRNIF
jgi:hypothetical protein